MACPVCGKPSPCAHELKRPAVLVGPEAYDQTEQRYSPQRPSVSPVEEFLIQAPEPWRQEVISRVQQHRARRRKRFDPNATMELDFHEPGSPSRAAFGLARDGVEEHAPESEEQSSKRSSAPVDPPKIIEFPRPRPPVQPVYFVPEPEIPSELELAEPVLDSPRILDAPEPPPEQLNLLPTFADIQLGDTPEYRPGHQVELPPQAAPLTHRVFALLIDMMMVLLGSAVFAITLIMFGRGIPQSRLALLSALLVGGSLWLIYQYVFMIYAPATPGMQLAELELCTFTGEPVPLPLRRWRVLAGMLSACAVGLGFLWAFVDEDTLSWHDRITQTHVRKAIISTQ
jgi:uncharacterized RDD family membrane protein YckC